MQFISRGADDKKESGEFSSQSGFNRRMSCLVISMTWTSNYVFCMLKNVLEAERCRESKVGKTTVITNDNN